MTATTTHPGGGSPARTGLCRRHVAAVAVLVALAASACSSSTLEVTPQATPDPSAPTTPEPTATAGDGSTTVGPDSGDPVPPFPEPAVDDTPLPVDDEVRIGRLDNGLTYYVRSNDTPGAAIQLRLVVNAGSLQQTEADSGLAHFLEHMMFNGTEAYPRNELDRVLQQLGAQIGPDFNAYTSFDETVYQLSLPSADDDTVRTGFDVLAQWASAATLDPDEVAAERGVVREELRLAVDSADARIGEVFLRAYLTGTPYEGRDPIGVEEQVLATTAEDLRTFYDDWYRPDLMAVVAVGDVSVDRLEDEVVAHFGELAPRGDDPARPEVEVDLIDTPFTEVLVDPEATDSFASIDISLPDWDPGTQGGERLLLLEDLIATMISNRLTDGAARGENDIIDPFVGAFPVSRAQRFLGFNFDAPDLTEATGYVLTDLARLEVTGFSESELARAAGQLQSTFDTYAAGEDTRQDADLAEAYVANFLQNYEISATDDWYERVTGLLEGFTTTDVNDHYRWVMDASAPLVILVAADASEVPTDAELAALVDDARTTGLAEGAAGTADDDVADIDELMSRPDATAPAATGRVAGLGATEIVFENGVTVEFLESTIEAGAVTMFASANGGWSALDPQDRPLATTAVDAVGRSGLAEFDRVALQRFLARENVSFGPYISELDEGFSGQADADDLEVLFQLLHLYVTEARVDEPALRQAIDATADRATARSLDPDEALYAELLGARYGEEQLAVYYPDPADLDALDAEQALAIYRERLDDVDDLVVVIVGDVDEDDVAELAVSYLGSLPAGTADTWRDVSPEPPDGVERREIEVGTGAASGAVAVSYTAEVDPAPRLRVAVRVLETVLDSRLFDTVREELGASYGGSVFIDVVPEPDTTVETTIVADGDPDRVEEIRDVIVDEVSDLASGGLTDDELERARSVVAADYGFVDNGYFIDLLLQRAQRPDEPLLTPDRRLDLVDEVDRDEVAALAELLFADDRWIEILRTPSN